jgi:hypothetical protein
MPATYVIDVRHKLVISKGTGVVTAADLEEHQKRLRSDPQFQPDFWQLADFSATTDVQVTVDDIRRLAQGSPFRSGSRRALVVPRPVLVGIGRMFQTLTEEDGVDLQLFDTLAEASRWLGIDT